MPLIHDVPTMVVGIKVHAKAFSLIASLNKEINSYFSDIVTYKTKEELIKLLPAALREALLMFKQVQRLIPRHVIIYEQVDCIKDNTDEEM